MEFMTVASIAVWINCGTVLLSATALHMHLRDSLQAAAAESAISGAQLSKSRNIVVNELKRLTIKIHVVKVEFIKQLGAVQKAGGYAEYELADDCSFKRAFWATQDQVERAMEFGLDVIQQALLEREDTEAFSWFFVHYVKMVGGHYPSMFRSLMQRASRAPTEASFQGAWKGLLDALVDAGASDDDVMKYLNDTIYPIRERWAFCYRLGVLTLGINSTQRCEGYFGILKAELLKVTTLCHLKQTLENITAR
ncbi:hypothetical protein JKP88DRAFT_285731 [Tribonema minus]|uniref:Uncharacterized protein n=1 Tax=Tribonema minus TaxID=303371 RepID=A0A835ZD50_9STRA|nr:hypothetical protein JKP88DRAFT_285731 [Tribonema minus]